jgi:hypothetical protein
VVLVGLTQLWVPLYSVHEKFGLPEIENRASDYCVYQARSGLNATLPDID